MQFVADITRDALAVLGITKLSEVKLLLQNIVIQEALLAMQKPMQELQRLDEKQLR